jgi:seryl-tRNA synthetase
MEINLQNELLKREAILKEQEDRIIERDKCKETIEICTKRVVELDTAIDTFADKCDEIISEIKIIKGIMESAGEDEQVAEENPKVVEQVEEIAEEKVEQVEEQEVAQVEEIVAEEIPVAIPEEQPKEIDPPKPQVPKIRPFPFRR